MVGTNAATGNRLVAGLRHGLIERAICRVTEHAARARAEELARVTWTDEAWHEHAEPDRPDRYAGLTPVRWVRLM